MVLCKLFPLIFQQNNEKKTTKAITTKQARRCKQKKTKSEGTKLTKENKFLTHFEPLFLILLTSENIRDREKEYWVKHGDKILNRSNNNF